MKYLKTYESFSIQEFKWTTINGDEYLTNAGATENDSEFLEKCVFLVKKYCVRDEDENSYLTIPCEDFGKLDSSEGTFEVENIGIEEYGTDDEIGYGIVIFVEGTDESLYYDYNFLPNDSKEKVKDFIMNLDDMDIRLEARKMSLL